MTLILGGRPVTSIPDADKVEAILDPKDDRLLFRRDFPRHTGGRDFTPRAIVIHWSGSENVPVRAADPDAKWSTVDTLIERGYSYDFMVDSAMKPGRRGIYQLADPVNTRCAHAGIANRMALGISCASRGFAAKEDVRGSDLLDRTELDWNEPRDVFAAEIDDERTHLVALHPDALHDLVWLVETLCGLLQIPRRIPWQSFASLGEAAHVAAESLIRATPVLHEGLWYLPLFDRDTRRWGRAAEYEGVYGHFHVHGDKWDPGPQPFEALWAEGFNPAGKKLPRVDARRIVDGALRAR